VIGSGPAGQKAAIAAAKLGYRAAVVERSPSPGGVSVHSGTIPSKAMREAVVYLSGLSQRELYGQSYRVKDEITVQDLLQRTDHMVRKEADIVRDQLARNGVIAGAARFADAHTLSVQSPEGEPLTVSGERVVVAVESRPARPPEVEFDGRRVIDPDDVLGLDHIPDSLVVVGAGVIGIEYASMFAALRTKVTVVERRERMLEFSDVEVAYDVGVVVVKAHGLLIGGRRVAVVHEGDVGPDAIVQALQLKVPVEPPSRVLLSEQDHQQGPEEQQTSCARCDGLGTHYEVDPELVVPNPDLSLAEGAVAPWSGARTEYFQRVLEAVAEDRKSGV
jgi:pyruvate/2-oxoglutarate dehydrogenase complex dihydrolipoamide dehydrogenase (E3) component